MWLGIITIIVVVSVIIFLSISFWITIFGGGPFVPTPMNAAKKVVKMAKIKKGQKVYDIGAGDGRFLHIAAKKYGAKAVGYERDPFVYFIAKFRQFFWGWKGEIHRANLFKQDLKDADVIICYMIPKTLDKIYKHFKTSLKKGTKIISYSFSITNLKPKKIIPKCGKINKIIIYEI